MADQEEDQGITAYHGSPHEFEQFDLSKIGTGEGAQAYGHGLYFAENEPVAKGYRERLTKQKKYDPDYWSDKTLPQDLSSAEETELRLLGQEMRTVGNLRDEKLARWKQLYNIRRNYQDALEAQSPKGHMYEVSINAHPDHFLDWDIPFSNQSEHVQKSLMQLGFDPEKNWTHSGIRGHDIYQRLVRSGSNFTKLGVTPEARRLDEADASQKLAAAGIKGIKYLDAGSRGKGDGTRNYVVFDDKLVNVKRRYARGGEIRDHLADGGNPGDIAGGGYGTGDIGGGSSVSSGGSMAEARAADRESVAGYSADSGGEDFGGGDGGGNRSVSGGGLGDSGRDYLGDMFNQSSRFGGSEIMSPFTGTRMGVPAASQQQMLDVLGIEGEPQNTGKPTNLMPGGNIGSDFLKQAVSGTGLATRENMPDERTQEQIDSTRRAINWGETIGKGISNLGSMMSAQPQGIEDPSIVARSNMAAQQPSGMLGQPPMGATTFGTGIRQSGFPEQQAGPTPNQSLEEYMGTVPPADMQEMITKQLQKTNQFNVNVKDFLDATGSPFAYSTTYGMAMPRLAEKNISFQPSQKIDPTTGLPATGIATFAGDMNAKLTPEQQAAKEEFDRQYGKTFTPIMKTSYGVEQRSPMTGGDLTGPAMTFDSFAQISPQTQTESQAPTEVSDVMRGTMGITPPSVAAQPRIGIPELAQQPVQTSDAQKPMTIRQNFNKAFAEARSRGDETFTWTNPATGITGIYGTKLARKEGGRVPSFDSPDEWLIEKNKTKNDSVKKANKRKPKPEPSPIVGRALMLSSSKS